VRRLQQEAGTRKKKRQKEEGRRTGARIPYERLPALIELPLCPMTILASGECPRRWTIERTHQPRPNHVMLLLLLIIESWISREDPSAVDEFDRTHQSWKFPAVGRAICEEKKKKGLATKVILREVGRKNKGGGGGVLTRFFFLLCVLDDDRYLQNTLWDLCGLPFGAKDLLDEPLTKEVDSLQQASSLRVEMSLPEDPTLHKPHEVMEKIGKAGGDSPDKLGAHQLGGANSTARLLRHKASTSPKLSVQQNVSFHRQFSTNYETPPWRPRSVPLSGARASFSGVARLSWKGRVGNETT
jgi:hypothetical protein